MTILPDESTPRRLGSSFPDSSEIRTVRRGSAWDRLAAAMDAMSQEAAANGLTPAALESLLSDES